MKKWCLTAYLGPFKMFQILMFRTNFKMDLVNFFIISLHKIETKNIFEKIQK